MSEKQQLRQPRLATGGAGTLDSSTGGSHPAVQMDAGRLLLSVRVIPRAARNEMILEADMLRMRLTAPPIEGAANEALVAFLAEKLHIPKRAVSIVRGATSRQKVVAVKGVTVSDFLRIARF